MPKLTDREKQVVLLICRGLKYKDIAVKLNLGHETIKTYVTRIRKKLNLSSKVAIVLWAQQQGLI